MTEETFIIRTGADLEAAIDAMVADSPAAALILKDRPHDPLQAFKLLSVFFWKTLQDVTEQQLKTASICPMQIQIGRKLFRWDAPSELIPIIKLEPDGRGSCADTT